MVPNKTESNSYFGSSWQNTDGYYFFINKLWNDCWQAQKEFLIADGEMKWTPLEIVYDSLLTWFDSMAYYFGETEIDEIEKIEKQIKEITRGFEFSLANLTAEDNTKIVLMIRELRKKLWKLAGKYQLLPKKQEVGNEVIW